MKKKLICIPLLFTAMSIGAQTVTYTYDNAGNRTARTVAANKSPEEPQQAITGVPDMIAEADIRIYPNPTDGIVTVEIRGYTHEMKADFRITNMAGKTMFHHKALHGSHTFNLSHQASGIYLLHITVNGKSDVRKIIRK